jgi:hypothetical protein
MWGSAAFRLRLEITRPFSPALSMPLTLADDLLDQDRPEKGPAPNKVE